MSVLTLGETMALFDPGADGPPCLGMPYVLRVAGAESNFAIGLARLGVGTRWISRVGDDPVGRLITQTLAAEGVDVGFVITERRAGTGAFLKIREGGRTGVQYFRRGSAAAHLTIGDVPDQAFDGVRAVHLTGITLALSESAAGLVVEVARRARDRGLIVTFDPNYRPTLWPNPTAARRAQELLLPWVDWYLSGEEEARTLWGAGDAVALDARIRSAGAKGTVIRIGERGALVAGAIVPPPDVVAVRDEIGAGDAFAAGFVFGLLQGVSPADCAWNGHVLAARALQGTGDWETLPRLGDMAGVLKPRP